MMAAVGVADIVSGPSLGCRPLEVLEVEVFLSNEAEQSCGGCCLSLDWPAVMAASCWLPEPEGVD